MEWDDKAARRLSTRELRMFLAVAHSGSMAKAAKTLATSQPAISKAIADMEHNLGVRLLDRSPQGVEPTQYGRALIKCGNAVFDELRQGLKEIEFLADPTVGELRIGCSEPFAAGPLVPVIDRLSRQHPRIAFHVETADATTLYGELRKRNVELVIARTFGPVAEDMTAEILYDDPLVVVASKAHPWTRRHKIKLSDLANEHWAMLPQESLSWSLLVDAFRASGLEPPRARVMTRSLHLRNRLLATGRFLAVLSQSALRFASKHPPLKVLPVELPMTRGATGIITLKNRTLSPLARLFIERTRAVAKQIAS